MTSRVLRWLHRHLLILLALIAAGALTTTLGSTLGVFSNFSAKGAENISHRAHEMLSRPIIDGEAETIRMVGDAILGSPSVYSLQIYLRTSNQRLMPFYGKTDPRSGAGFPWYAHKLLPLLSPLLQHEKVVDVKHQGETIGKLTLRFRDYARVEAAVRLSAFFVFLSFLMGTALVIGSHWWRNGYYYLIGVIHREACSEHLLQADQSYPLRHYPLLQRLHALVCSRKKEMTGLREEVRQLREQIAMYQRLISKTQHQLDSGGPANDSSLHSTDIDHLVILTQHLKESIKDPEQRATADLVHHALLSQATENSWILSPHGEIDLVHLTCVLYQSVCQRRDPRVMLDPRTDLRTHYQGNIADVMRITNHLLDICSSNSNIRSTLWLFIEQHPHSSHLMLTCRLSDPSVRNIHDHGSKITQRRSFVTLQEQLEKSNARVTLKTSSEDHLDIQVVLPLLPAREGRLDHLPDLSGLPIFIAHNGSRAESLHHTYRRLGTTLPLVSHDKLSGHSAGIALLVNENGGCDTTMADRLTAQGHKVILMVDNQSRGQSQIEDAFASLDLHGSPLYHLEQVKILTQPSAPVSLFDTASQPHEAKSFLSNFSDLLSASSNENQAVWIPMSLSPLVRASLTTPLMGLDVEIKEYDTSDQRPLQLDDQDVVFVDTPTMTKGGPSTPLGRTARLVLLIQDGEKIPDIDEMPDVRHVLSLPADTGYLTSIVMRAGHLQ